MRRHGVYEWAAEGDAIDVGCPYGCRYCYARAAAIRRRQVPDAEAWRTPREKRSQGFPRRGARVMFPTTHDVGLWNLDRCIRRIRGLLDRGCRVLVVSKMSLDVALTLAENFGGEADQLEARVTIGTLDANAASFWEPWAPAPFERLAAVELLARHCIPVSVSAEPLLKPWDARRLAHDALAAGASHVWLGLMNEMDRRVRIEDAGAVDTLVWHDYVTGQRRWQEDGGGVRAFAAWWRAVEDYPPGETGPGRARGVVLKDTYNALISRVDAWMTRDQAMASAERMEGGRP